MDTSSWALPAPIDGVKAMRVAEVTVRVSIDGSVQEIGEMRGNPQKGQKAWPVRQKKTERCPRCQVEKVFQDGRDPVSHGTSRPGKVRTETHPLTQ